MPLTTVEICAGAGGQALGLEQAGFHPLALVEVDPHCCATLRLNRPQWNVLEQDLCTFSGEPYRGVDLLAGGLPCPPFSVAGKQLGKADERNLFPEAIRLVDEIRPRAVMIENVRGILDAGFSDYRNYISGQIAKMGYRTQWQLLNACDFGVPQLRPRVVFIALRDNMAREFCWPTPLGVRSQTVGECLADLMQEKGWRDVSRWREKASVIAPTIVGGSKKHGGPDLGPTRAKKAWAAIGVDGHGVAYEAPDEDFLGMPRLTVRMVARLQGFPDDWQFFGSKTASYRQVGNAFPPPVARSVGCSIIQAISKPRVLERVA